MTNILGLRLLAPSKTICWPEAVPAESIRPKGTQTLPTTSVVYFRCDNISATTKHSSVHVLDKQCPSVVLSTCHWRIDQSVRLNAPIDCNQHLWYGQYKSSHTQPLARFHLHQAVLHTFSHRV